MKKRTRVVKNGRHRAKREKTFTNKEAAMMYAKAKGIEKYHLVYLRQPTSVKKAKIKIVSLV